MLRVASYNIRKGKGASGRQRPNALPLGEALASERLDVVMCQEVFHSSEHPVGQSHQLARATGLKPYYRPNKQRRVGHHGNATLTHLPVDWVQNYDVSTNRIERRGVLYTRMLLASGPLHVFNAHLSLSHRQRRAQLQRIDAIVRDQVPHGDPIVLAGDFNDWQQRLDRHITGELGFVNVFAQGGGSPPRTWHSRRPIFNLDRLYVRGLKARSARRLAGEHWSELSDHLPIAVTLAPI